MSEVKELCPHCGASMMMNKYSMNLTLLRALFKLNNNQGKQVRDTGMNKSEFNNYTKMKFWGLIQKHEDGVWSVTDKGRSFLLGKISVPREIVYFRNRLVESSGMVNAFDIPKTVESKQKYRELMESSANFLGN